MVKCAKIFNVKILTVYIRLISIENMFCLFEHPDSNIYLFFHKLSVYQINN